MNMINQLHAFLNRKYNDGMAVNRETADRIIEWYRVNKRTLPWRDTGDPYKVWISEIMLQQTRIEAVRGRYLEFMQELPDIPALAAVSDDRLMRLWEGMGYYSRARNLKKCAITVMEEYDGHLPADYEKLKKLPGIGPYTAGAIASIAFGIPVPAVDGNVMRVIARLEEIRDDIRSTETKKLIERKITDLFEAYDLSGENVSLFNQGIMELGETVCLPNGKPHCSECTLSDHCAAHCKNETDDIPFRSALKKRKIVERTLLIIRDGDHFLLQKRPENGLLAGLYEFPGVDGHLSESEALKKAEDHQAVPVRIKRLPDSKHVFSHLEWHMIAYEILTEEITDVKDGILITKKELAHKAVPSAFKTYTDWYQLRD